MGHLNFHVMPRPLWLRSQARQHRLHSLPHQGKGHLDAGLCKCRLHHGALARPLRATGGQDAVAQQRAQCIAHQVALGKFSGFLDQHPTHQRGRIHHVKVEPRQMHLAHLHAVAALVETVQPGAARTEKHQKTRCFVFSRARVSWAEMRHDRADYLSAYLAPRVMGPAVIAK